MIKIEIKPIDKDDISKGMEKTIKICGLVIIKKITKPLKWGDDSWEWFN